MIYIGIDLHARHFSMAVLNQDDSIMFEETLPTSSQNLQAAIGAFSPTKNVVFEESTLAGLDLPPKIVPPAMLLLRPVQPWPEAEA